ncbi:MAG: methyltransferase domain-containing protein [Desulfovermiculus sp.]|nr:methyltransferase domain-containing protein [Desulfovermiculus sp.]
MKKALMDMLICSACLPRENELSLHAEKTSGQDVIQGQLTCSSCGQVYPIRDGLADLDPARAQRSHSKYEQSTVVSSYLWSHYGDILQDEQACPAYDQWAKLMHPHIGMCLDIGAAVGRFAFEMAQKCDFVLGLDNSVAFIQAARELKLHGHKALQLPDEGRMTVAAHLQLPESWNRDNVEFIVADAQALPVRSKFFSSAASLNMVDKVPYPLTHLAESNRVLASRDAQFLLSDPFSWSSEAAREEDWLGGLESGPFAGHGLENIRAMLQDQGGPLAPPWSIQDQGHVWWKIRTHSNHFELIRSCWVKASR